MTDLKLPAGAIVRVTGDDKPFVRYPHLDDPLLQWHAVLDVHGLAVTRLVWNEQGRGPKLVQFKYRKRPCSLNGLFELAVPRVKDTTVNGQTASWPTPEFDHLGTVRGTIDGVRIPDVHWHTRDARGTEGAVMVADQEWQVVQFKGGGSRATAHLGVEPERVVARLVAAVEAFEAGTVNTEVSARVRGTSRTFRRKL